MYHTETPIKGSATAVLLTQQTCIRHDVVHGKFQADRGYAELMFPILLTYCQQH